MPPRKTSPVDLDATPKAKNKTRSRGESDTEVQAQSKDLWDYEDRDTDGASDKPIIPNGPADELWRRLTARLPKGPGPYKFGEGQSSTSSRRASESDFALSSARRLELVVPHRKMMHNLVPKLKRSLDALPELPANHPLWARLDVSLRCAYLPNNICTERDSEHWIHSVILRPATAVIHYLLTQTEKGLQENGFPNISSVGGKKPIPDAGSFRWSRKEGDILIMEFKKGKVLEVGWVEVVDGMIKMHGATRGMAAKFRWPEEGQPLTENTNIFVQLWGQMLNWNVKHLLVSSYDHTYFLATPSLESTTLYISKGYTPDGGELLPATIAFMAMALGILPESDLDLPEVDITHWPRGMSKRVNSGAGLDTSSYQVKAKKK